ncbi:hypothetical protein [Dactylosporangium darangshiense]|uniref:Uncharacterized protein n=1 Tax=Dactylosporangium darangshiense TaxID=579108 RepID=A0ABP8CUG1_9ACTN
MTTIQTDSSYYFNTTLDHPAPGYWRAYYPGQQDMFQSATSTKIQVA